MGQKISKERQIQLSTDYVAFLKKRVESVNYRLSVSEQEYKKTKEKYEKEKLRLKLLKN